MSEIRLDLLIFSVHGVRFGVDAGQVAGIETYDGEQADDLFWFHRELDYGGAESPYRAPVVAAIRTGSSSSYRIIIDSMEDVAEFSQQDISLFPALLEPLVMRKGMWGILSRYNSMVLLIDFYMLLKHKRN